MKKQVDSIRSKASVWMIFTGLLLSVGVLYLNRPEPVQEHAGITKSDFDHGWKQCQSFDKKTKNPDPSERTRNPRYSVGFQKPTKAILISNATLLDGDGKLSLGIDIVLQDGLIKSVGNYDFGTFDGELINANGRFVTPGIVDMHSHMGMDSWPGTQGHSDTNEMTETPLHPQLKSLDGFDPWDLAIRIINSGGITTSLVLPGSGNMMGGEAFAFKHRLPPSNRAEDMLLNAGMKSKDGDQLRWMKMACGENPIRNYGPKNVMPGSRLGEGYLFRKRMNEALKAKQEQEQWCHEARFAKKKHSSRAHLFVDKRYPEPIEHESLIALLRGQVYLNVHCYESYDLEMMVRLSKEYGFKIRAFHHALEAWRVGEMLSEEDIGVALFADHWGYKKEAYDSSVNAAKILTDKGVKVAFKSDHPVLNSQNLVYEAAKAHHYGLSPELAISAVTSVPAERLGQDWRIGYVRTGYDADVVIWDKHPLELGAHPLRVFVDGYTTFVHSDYNKTIDTPFQPYLIKQPSNSKIDVKDTIVTAKAVTYSNITALISSPDARENVHSKIVVEDGIITCLGSQCVTKGDVVDLKGGWVIPGIIAGGVHLGLEVIASESLTSAGKIENDSDVMLQSSFGVRIGREKSRLLDTSFKAGVTTAVVSYRHRGAVGAYSTAFRVGSKRADSAKFVKKVCLPNFLVGNSAISAGIDISISGQIAHIKKYASGRKYVFDVNAADHIMAIVDSFGSDHSNITLQGAAEAHSIADELAAYVKSGFDRSLSVVLNPARCTPSGWFNQACLVTSTSPSALHKLQKAGINVAISVPEDNSVRGLIWEAGWQVADLPDYEHFSDFEIAKQSAALVTWNVAKAFGIDDVVGTIRVGQAPNFVVYNDVPGTLAAKVVLVVDGDILESNTAQP